jgi:hypothetical protein
MTSDSSEEEEDSSYLLQLATACKQHTAPSPTSVSTCVQM